MDRIQKRFDELADEAKAIDASRTVTSPVEGHARAWDGSYQTYTKSRGRTDVDFGLFMKWRTSVNEFLQRVFGDSSKTAQSFAIGTVTKSNNARLFDQLYAIFLSAKEQYEGGYLIEVANLVHANVFGDELEQAEYLLDGKYKVAAAVTAGVVLETTLRRLCDENRIPTTNAKGKRETMDPLNIALAKAGVYPTTQQKEITTWAGIRNDAAHGTPENFTDDQVKSMIPGIRAFINKYLS